MPYMRLINCQIKWGAGFFGNRLLLESPSELKVRLNGDSESTGYTFCVDHLIIKALGM